MKLAVGISTYGNAKGLDYTLASVYPKVDRIIVIHGRYLGFPDSYPNSEDQTRALLSKYPDITLICNSTPVTQIEQRNIYMREAKGCGLLLVMDDDERIEVWNREKLELWYSDIVKKHLDEPTMFNVWLFPKIQSEIPFDMPGRMFYLPERIRYLGNHYNYTIDGKHVGRSSKYSVDSGALIIRHLDPKTAERTDEFEKSMEGYEIWQLYEEKHGNEFG